MSRASVRYAPGFGVLAGQDQSFTPFVAHLPTLGDAVVVPADEMATVVVLGPDKRPRPGVIIATQKPGMPPLALMFQPTRDQARRMAMTLLAFAEGREADLVAAARQ